MTTTTTMRKHVLIGNTKYGRAFATIDWNGSRLSITGVIGPEANGNATGSFGQCVDDVATCVPLDPWTVEMRDRLVATWRRWHLNDMRAGCEHQRAEEWDKRPIDPAKPTNHHNGRTWNMLTWVTRKQHPEGLLCEPCPTCGYKYGSAWLHEPVPDDVIAWLQSLPATTSMPTRWMR